MYRLFLTILLCLKAAAPAPQKESDVTYVKIQPVVEDTPADTASTRESRIEKLPLTFPGNVSTFDSKALDKNISEDSESTLKHSEHLSVKKSELSVDKTALSDRPESLQDAFKISENQDLPESLLLSETNQSDTISDPNGTEESNTTDDLTEISPTDTLSDTVASETSQSDRHARNFDSAETTETTEDATEKYEDDISHHTVIEAPRTRAPPKFVPKVPKSSYIPKPRVFQSYSANHLDIVGKRKFRSRCSCQKIWNCPKLQISVPRCPDEYFLCCF